MLRGTIISILFACVLVIAQDPLLSVDNQVTPWAFSKTQKKLGCKSALPGSYATTECLAGFISEQLQLKGTPNYALAATFRVGWDYVPPVVSGGEYPKSTGEELSERADIYDNAMAVIFLLNEGQVDPAKKICDTLVLIANNEPSSDGRLKASYSVANPINRQNYGNDWASFAPKATDDSIDTGDQAFVIIALTRMYVHTGDYKYLKAALKIGTFLSQQLINSNWSGYAGGFSSSNEQKVDWRSLIHNLAIYSAADNLFGLTQDKQWTIMQANAERFIANMFDTAIGAYRYGSATSSSDEWNTKTVSAHAQSFKVLSGADSNEERNNQALQWIINNLITYDSAFDEVTGQNYRYEGVLHAQGGEGIDTESTAAVAMAMILQGDKIQGSNPTLANTFRETGNNLLVSLLQMQKYAPHGDGQGIVASPNPNGALVWPGNEFNGETYRYFPLLHTASTAWTGCAVEFIQMGDQFANPFSSYYKKSNKHFFGSSVFASASGIQVIPLDSSRPLNIVALIAAGLIGGLLVLGTVVLCVTNARLYKRNKQLENRQSSTPIKFEKLATATPLSPGTPSTPNRGGLSLQPLGTTGLSHTMYASPATPSQEESFLH